MAAQDQSLQTRWVKYYIETTDSLKCRMCGKMGKNFSHLISECNELAQNEYKKLRHDKVTALLHWQWRRLMDSGCMINMNTSLKRK